MHLELGQLRALAVLADELSFTRAARRLGVAQPALSAQISRIERRLGRKLVERSTRSVVLTPAGQDLVARARRVLAEAEADSADAPETSTGRGADAAGADLPGTGGSWSRRGPLASQPPAGLDG